jgi:hypothetical protein
LRRGDLSLGVAIEKEQALSGNGRAVVEGQLNIRVSRPSLTGTSSRVR